MADKTFNEQERTILLKDYESKKHRFDYTDIENLTLQGGSPRAILHLSPGLVRKAFDDVFKNVLAVIKREINILIHEGKSFGMVFCGGSFLVLGIQQQMRTYMENEVASEAQLQGTQVSHAFLSLCDTTWSSAVATGAAVSLFNT